MKITTLVFNNNGTLSKLVDFSRKRPRHIPYTKKTTDELGVWLVKDDGIYIMAPTKENFVDNELKGSNASTVVYAKGYEPTEKNRDTLWEKTHDVSGDDFAEFIPLHQDQVDRIVNLDGNLKIKLSETKLEIVA